MSHAVLSPSAASRWLGCTPSARLAEKFPNTSSAYAEEGTLAHSIGELLLSYKLNLITADDYTTRMAVYAGNKYYSAEMLEHCENYVAFVLERYAEAKAHTNDAVIFLERKLDLREFVPDGFGTGDAVIIADKILEVDDLKYGKGVPVSADNNKQLMLYGLGALKDFDYMYDIKTVRVTIFQPRLDSISTWEIPAAELIRWAEQELKPRAALAFDGAGEFVAGNHCLFCPAKGACRANAMFNLAIAKQEFEDGNLVGDALKQPETLTDAEISAVLTAAPNFTKWIKAVVEYALYEAIKKGKQWPGYKLVTGKSNRTFKDETAVAKYLLKEGFTEKDIFTKPELLGITAIEKLAGKDHISKLADWIVKPTGAPTLAPLTDKRPALNSIDAAKLDFAPVE